MHKLDVPYYSQHKDVTEPIWHSRSCGIVCVKMILDFLKEDAAETIDDLITEGVLVGGYTTHGWSHDGLVSLFRNRGVHAYREEFRSVMFDTTARINKVSAFEQKLTRNGISKIANMLAKGKPVMVSVEAGFDENTSSHLIVLTGFSEDEVGIGGFFYNDPDSREGVKKDHFVEMDVFRKFWRKMAIFVG